MKGMKFSVRGRKQKKYTRQVILYMSAAVTIVALISFLGLYTYQRKTEKIFADITENLEFALIYENAGQVRESVERYLDSGDEEDLEGLKELRQRAQDKMGEDFVLFIDNADDITGAVQRKNLVGIYQKFVRTARGAADAKGQGEVDTYLKNYEEMLDVYREIDLYIKEITSNQLMEKANQYEEFREQMSRVYWIAAAAVVLITILVLFLITSYSVEMTRPILRLSEYAKRIEKGDFDFEIGEETSSEEMQILYHSVSNMKDGIRDNLATRQQKQELERMLNEQKIQNLEMSSALKEAELQTLQAQIDPHFLFNTINIGAQMATLHDDDATAGYFYHVADLFRYNINGFEKGAYLEEEIRHALNYVNLMKVRFGDKYQFSYEQKVEEKFLKLQMPKLILQPMIENAYVHGVRKNENGGRIVLSVRQEEDMLCVSVRDNGPGMTKEEREQILSGVRREEREGRRNGNGVGLGNVIERLRLWYKREEVMRIVCENGITEFVLLLPIKEEEEGIGNAGIADR